MKPLRKIAFVINKQKDGAAEVARELVATTRAAGVALKQTTRCPIPREYLEGCDACCVVGGDGTLLGAAREAARWNVPLIGVNQGSLGFLTTFSADEARQLFPELLAGRFHVDHRAMLDCSTGPGVHDLALNDVLVKSEANSRIVRLEVLADSELVTTYTCDGLIFSTATGSTAYNLSAGGPIIHPDAGVIAMTPICPHTLSNRAIIFRQEVKLRVINRTEDCPLLVAMDGQLDLRVGMGSPIDISLSKLQVPLAHRDDYSHFAVVRTKLKWGGEVVGSTP